MQRLKFFLMFVASVMLLACSGGEDPASGGSNNGGETPDKPNPETPVTTETLPQGVEIGEETQQLNNIQLGHIETVDEDNSTLTFSAELPAEHIPQKGQILLQYTATDDLPYGFLGRVTNVTTVGNNIIVETEAPALDEAFARLSFTYDIDIQPENTRADDDGYAMFTPSINIPFPIGSVNGGIGVGGKLTVMNDLVTAEDKDVSGYNLDIKLVGDFALNIAMKTKEPLELYGKIPLMKDGVEIPTPAKSIGLKLMLVPTIVMRAEGEAGCHLKADFEATRSFRIIKNGSQTTKEDNEIGNTTPVSSFDGDADMGFYLDGKVFAGVAAKFELTFFGRKEIKVEISPEVGANFSAALEADFAKLGYTAFKDNMITTSVGFGVSASGTFNLFNKWHTEWSLPLVSHKFGEQQFYLFPNFKDGTYSVNENQTAHGTITVERDLFWKNDVAIGQYDADGNKVEVKGSLPYKYEAGFSNPLTASFIHKDKYSYWSVIKWGGDYLKCMELENEESEYILSKIITTSENGQYVYTIIYDNDGRIAKIIESSGDTLTFLYQDNQIIISDNNKYNLNSDGLISSFFYKNVFVDGDGNLHSNLDVGEFTYDQDQRKVAGKSTSFAETPYAEIITCSYNWDKNNLISVKYSAGDQTVYRYNSVLNNKVNLDLNNIVIAMFDESGFPVHLEIADWATFYLTAQGYTGPRCRNFVIYDSCGDETYAYTWKFNSSNVPISCIVSGEGEFPLTFTFEYQK